jgi:glutamate dehydrogenase
MPDREVHNYASSISSMTQQELLAAIARSARQRLNRADADAFDIFCREYFDCFSLEDLEGRQLDDVFGMAYSCWSFLALRAASAAKVALLNPILDDDGWVSNHTALLVLQCDMPFLVDSVHMELTRRNIAINTIKSTIVGVQRNSAGKLLSLSSVESGCDEAFIYVEIDKHTDDTQINDLRQSMLDVLSDVEVVVTDYHAILAELGKAKQHLVEVAPNLMPDMVQESCEFLQWLGANHFTFLGYSEHAFVKRKDGRYLE